MLVLEFMHLDLVLHDRAGVKTFQVGLRISRKKSGLASDDCSCALGLTIYL